MHVKLKTTMIYVTHDQVEAMTMADEIVVPNAGRIEQAEGPAHGYAELAGQFLARFTMLSCAKVRHDGTAAPNGVAARTELIAPERGQWIRRRDAFTTRLRALWTDGTATVLGRCLAA